MPEGPGLQHVKEEECNCLLRDIWPNYHWRAASENKRNDVFHLLGLKRNGHDCFLTNDREILKKSKILADKYDIRVMSPQKFLAVFPPDSMVA